MPTQPTTPRPHDVSTSPLSRRLTPERALSQQRLREQIQRAQASELDAVLFDLKGDGSTPTVTARPPVLAPIGFIADARGVAATQVEISRPPQLSSYDLPAVRTFLAEERTHARRRATTNIAPTTLVELMHPSLLPSLHMFILRSTGCTVAPHSEVPPDGWAVWNATLREALEKWATGARHLSDATQDELLSYLSTLVWPLNKTFDEALLDFERQWHHLLYERRLEAPYTAHKRMERRVVTALVATLRPAAWKQLIHDHLERVDKFTLAYFWEYLPSQRTAFTALCRPRGPDTRPSPRGPGAPATGVGTARPLSRPCRHCGQMHLDKDCPRRVSTSTSTAPAGASHPPATTASTSRPAPSTTASRPAAATAPTSGTTSRPPAASTSGPRSPCRHCGGAHWNSECPTAAATAAAAARSRPTARPAGPGAHVRRAAVLPPAHDSSDGLVGVGATHLPCVLDTGATASFISPEQLTQLQAAASVPISTAPLPVPVHVATAEAGRSVVATESVHVPRLTVTSHEGAQHVIEDARLLLTPDLNAREILLGRDVYWKLPEGVRHSLLTPRPPDNFVSARSLQLDPGLDDAELDPVDVGFEYTHDPEAQREEVCADLERAVDDARREGMPEVHLQRLSAALFGPLFDVFRNKLGPDPPADVEPIRVQLVPGAESRLPHQPPRSYGRDAGQFVDNFMARLVKDGIMRPVHFATCASPANPVRRHNVPPDTPPDLAWRLTWDFRQVNALTRLITFPMPNADEIVDLLGQWTHRGKCDLSDCFFQVPLHPDCQEYFTVITRSGTYVPNRLLQGGKNGNNPCQSVVRGALGELVPSACVSIVDDLAVGGKTWDELVDNWIRVLTRLLNKGFKVKAKKLVLFTRRLLYFGRVYTDTGVEYDPAAVHSIANMPRPVTLAQLSSYVAFTNWLRQSVPNYAHLVDPLLQLQTACLRLLPRGHTTTARERFSLAEHWTSSHDAAFAAVNSAIVHATALAYPRPDRTVCVWTDASSTHWSAVITQCTPDQLDKPYMEQLHEPLAFFSGPWRGAELRYPTTEQEGLAFVNAVRRAEHLLQGPAPFHWFTDHANLVSLFSLDPKVAPSKPQAHARVQRWAIFLRAFRYVAHHIPGDQNLLPDALTRWAAPPPLTTWARRAVTRQQLRASHPPPVPTPAAPPAVQPAAAAPAPPDPPAAQPAPPQPSSIVGDPAHQLDFDVYRDCPSESEICAAQDEFVRTGGHPPPGVHRDSTGTLRVKTGQLYVPPLLQLPLRLLITAHQGLAGHRGVDVTRGYLEQHFWWPTLAADVHQLVVSCLHCLRCRHGVSVPRPLRHTAAATAPHQLLHFDFLFVSRPREDSHGLSYLLVVIDAFSRFVRLVPSPSADADTVVRTLLGWFKDFGIVRRYVSDQGSHFTAGVIAALRGLLAGDHHFVTAYSPWANGVAERANQSVMRQLRLICSETKTSFDDWPRLVDVVSYIINHSPSTVLGGYTPAQVHCGVQPQNPLSVVFRNSADDFVDVSPSVAAIQRHADLLHQTLDSLHRDVGAIPRRKRSARPGEQPVNFGVGDFVLVARRGAQARGNKLATDWMGPSRVVDVKGDSGLVFVVEDLITGARSDIHAAHLLRYSDKQLRVTPQLFDHVAHASSGHVISCVIGHRLTPTPQLHIRWEGYGAAEDTWEPLSSLLSDAPSVVHSYVRVVDTPADKAALLACIQDLAK